MTNLLKLLFALFLGLLAAGANWVWVSAKAKPPEFVAAKSALKLGRSIGEDDLVAVPVPGDLDRLKKTLIPYKNRAILFGTKAVREYQPGDVFFHRDILPPEEKSNWDVVGPFRLISVGGRFKVQDGSIQAYSNDSSRNNVTIEVSADFDDKTRRLLEVISPNTSSEAKKERLNIVAVQVVPSQTATPNPKQPAGANMVYQTVSLDGIANVPRVLLAGDMIRFVIPGQREY